MNHLAVFEEALRQEADRLCTQAMTIEDHTESVVNYQLREVLLDVADILKGAQE